MSCRIRRWVARLLRRRLGFPLQEPALERLKAAGFAPRVVFDVGASYGIFARDVWSLWPQAQVHAFEPEPEYVSQLSESASRDTRLVVVPNLVGAHSATGVSYYFHLGASSVLPSSDVLSVTRSGDMITLEEYSRRTGVVPDLLKIDVQGFELEVLRGARNLLSGVEVVFTEVNHIEIYRGAPLAAELIAWMADAGFALHDICNFMPRPRDGTLWQTDMIFVRHDSRLRSSTSWS